MWSGGASLHPAEELLRGPLGFVRLVSVSRVSPRSGLVKLLALSNFQARRRILIRVSRAFGQICLFELLILYHRCVLPYDRMRALVTGISATDV